MVTVYYIFGKEKFILPYSVGRFLYDFRLAVKVTSNE